MYFSMDEFYWFIEFDSYLAAFSNICEVHVKWHPVMYLQDKKYAGDAVLQVGIE